MSTFYYPMVKSIAKFFDKSMARKVFFKGISKTIPVVGELAGGLTLAKVCLGCTDEDFENDLKEMRKVIEAQSEDIQPVESAADNTLDFNEELVKTKRLLDDGVISKIEFTEIKARIIANQ